MKVSVIVPVYNVEKYIEKCLISIKNQTLKDFECLIINDGTKDKSVEIAKKVIADDNRFKIINKENGGLSDTKNVGINKANGEYLCFIDSDDYIDETLLEKTYNMAKKYDSDITCFDLYYVWDDRIEISKASYKEILKYQEDKNLLFINNSSNNKLYKTSFMKDKMFIKGMWYEDLAVTPIWMAKANNVSYVNEPLYYYIQREGSISHSADPRVFDIYKAIDNVQSNLKLSSKEIKKLYYNNCLIMTTLRIKDYEDKKIRLEYYKKNIELLSVRFSSWYRNVLFEDYNFKQKIIFTLLKLHLYNLVDNIYNKKTK